MEKRGPYDFIELSTDSEPETTGPAVAAPGVQKAARPKKDAVISAQDDKIKKLMKVSDYGKITDELEKLVAQVKKIKEGSSMVFLRRIHSLESFVANPKDKNNQQLKLLKRKLKDLHTEFEDQLTAAGSKLDEEESEDESQQVAVEEVQQKAKVEEVEEEEIDFAKRLKLSKDERRKFWYVKKKEAPKEKVSKKGGRTKLVKEKVVAEHVSEFANVRTDDAGLKSILNDISSEKNFMKLEEKEKAISKLEYISEKIEGPRLAEVLMLLLNLKLDVIFDSDFVEVEVAKDIIEDFKDLLKVGPGQTLNAFSRSEGREIEINAAEVISRISKLLLAFDTEHQTKIIITDPFSEDYSDLLAQEIEIMKLLKRVRKLADESPKTKALVALRELRHMHSWKNEILLSSDALTELVDYGSIEGRSSELLELVTAHGEEQEVALARLFYAHCLAINQKDPEMVRKLLVSAQRTSALFTEKYNVGVYNRTVAYLGLCLFDQAKFFDAKAALEHLLASENLQENLSQFDVTVSQAWEYPDPTVLLPMHLHLNIKYLDASYLLLCMLFESHFVLDTKQHFSERFSRFLDFNSKNLFLNSSVDVFDRLYSLFNKLQNFDVKGALEAVGDEFSDDPDFLAKLRQEIASEAARCFVEHLRRLDRTSINVKETAELFLMPYDVLHGLIKLKIEDRELKGSLEGDVLTIDNEVGASSDISMDLVEKLHIFNQILNSAENLPKTQREQKNNTMYEISQLLQANFERKEKPLYHQIASEIFKSKTTSTGVLGNR